ncbi:hypothetical protein [Ferrimicrobium acidiphilum]|uniref:hypothetical protein n=1 Tax=Ferrimicrobium acidiphilum TaxID=121039 RepID=UPI0023F12611|nr:hypothetical protein [Ferrimicrobium acidiphilum]
MPWILLVEQAGGRFTDRTGGHAGDQGGGLYSNATLLLTTLHIIDCRPRVPPRRGSTTDTNYRGEWLE